MKKIKLLYCIIFVLGYGYSSLINAQIIKDLTSYQYIDFDNIDNDTLVVFDVDETLVQPIDSLLVNLRSSKSDELFYKIITRYPDVDNWDYYYSIIFRDVEMPLIENNIINKIKSLQNRNIKVIACTAAPTGRMGAIENVEEWRYNHLYSLGFIGNFNDFNFDFYLEGQHPNFYHGILFTDLANKGPSLKIFLDKINYHPKKIVMFDDNLNYLQSVDNEFAKSEIQFTGYQYTGQWQKEIDEEMFFYQIDYLLANHKWLSDIEYNLEKVKELLYSQ